MTLNFRYEMSKKSTKVGVDSEAEKRGIARLDVGQ